MATLERSLHLQTTASVGRSYERPLVFRSSGHPASSPNAIVLLAQAHVRHSLDSRFSYCMETDGGSVLPSARKFGHATASDNNTRPSWAIWLSRLLQRARTHRSALLKWSITLVACCVVLHSVTSSIGSLLLQRARNKARSQQQLVGFSTARLEHLPDNIKSEQLGEPQLLAHPLLTKVKTPSCRLNTYQEDRYAPLEPAYGAGPRGARAHYLPRHRLKYCQSPVCSVTPSGHAQLTSLRATVVALNLYDSEKVLPSLIKVIHSALVALGPSRFHVSIFENGSKDDTPAQLVLLAQLLKRIGAGYTIVSDPLRQAGFQAHHRIETLAELRNLALKPLFEAPKGTYDRVIFINDVHFCEADLYEIMLQNEVQDADMSCGMDYQELKIPEFKASGYPLLFYDVWVARDMLGL